MPIIAKILNKIVKFKVNFFSDIKNIYLEKKYIKNLILSSNIEISRIIKILFFILFFSHNSLANNTKVEEWNEYITLTKTGVKTKVEIIFRIIDLPKNYHINSYQISSSAKNLIKYSQINVDDMPAESSQADGTLSIKLNQPKKD